MQYWLIKSDPDTWDWKDQMKAGAKGTCWDGVRNYQARNNMVAMKKGDYCLFYHSQTDPGVQGVTQVIKEAYRDHTAGDDDRWEMVDVAVVKAFKNPVTLKEMKSKPGLKNMGLLKQGRLSVSPVTEKEFSIILELGAIKL